MPSFARGNLHRQLLDILLKLLRLFYFYLKLLIPNVKIYSFQVQIRGLKIENETINL